MTTPKELASEFALIRECNDAASLFSRGLAITEAIRTDYQNAVVVMSLLTLGAEKMLKITIGLAERDHAGTWPTKDYMRWKIGHRVATADRIAWPLLDLHPGTARGWLDGLKADVAGDSVLPNLLEAPEDFLRKQVVTSRYVRGGRLVTAALGGLNYQIEHHLFPGMPSPNLRKAQPIVQAYCAEIGVPYEQAGLIDSYRQALQHLHQVGAPARAQHGRN